MWKVLAFNQSLMLARLHKEQLKLPMRELFVKHFGKTFHCRNINSSKSFQGSNKAESRSDAEHYPKNLMRIIPTKGEKQ